MAVQRIDHPLVQHKITLMRDKMTGPKEFRELVAETAMLMCYEATRDLPTKEIEIATPMGVAKSKIISGRKLAFVPILRAGLGMMDGLMTLVPAAKVGHIGLFRDTKSHEPVEYYVKLPEDIAERDVIVVDPPRKGCDSTLLETIVKMEPEKVVYVSCDSATLARDLKYLCENGYEIRKVRGVDQFPETVHVETVVKLVRKAPDAYIDITVDMDELDLTASEAKATYEEIKQYILDKYDTKVSNLYIAQVKEKYGIIERENYNKPKSENSKQPQCPAEKVEMIEEALRHFKMI